MNLGYIRVSSRDQNTARQLDGVLLDIPPFIDKVSGALLERPKLQECLMMLRKGDTLHVHSMDRLARNLVHLEELVKQLGEKGVTLQLHQENLIITPGDESPMGAFIMHIFGAVAQFERSMIKTRQREGIAQAKIKGTRSGKPFGKPPLDKKLKLEAIRLLTEGQNVSQIASSLKISRASVYKFIEGHSRTINY